MHASKQFRFDTKELRRIESACLLDSRTSECSTSTRALLVAPDSDLGLDYYAAAFTFFVLLLTGAGAAFVAPSRDGVAATVCGFAAGVNAVAVTHYVLILRAIRPIDDSALQAADRQRIRYSDWLVTLPFMALDLCYLTKDGADGVTIPKGWAAVLAFVGVALGAAAEQLHVVAKRSPDWKRGALALFGVAFALATLSIALCMWGILEPALSATRTSDTVAVQVLTFVWLGYPIVFLLRALVLWYECGGASLIYTSLTLETLLDASYSLLDVVSKGGLAYWAATRKV